MKEAGISWVHFKEVLSALERQGFVQSGKPKLDGRRRDNRINKVYTVTEKGVNVLQYFRNAKEFELVDLAIPF
jgi:DNA-binding PadR family transcriptional regulator